MSLLSRNAGGGRRVAKSAAVFAGTLLTYLVVTVVPAQAVTTCAVNGAEPAQLDVAVGTDDTAALFSTGGSIVVLVNGGLVNACPGGLEGAIQYINVTGSNAGNEKLIIWNPQSGLPGDNTSVGLGNGTDSLTWEYGNLGAPWAIPDFAAGVGADAVIGTSAGGLGIGDFNNDGLADLRIDNAEVNALNGDTVGDSLDAGNLGDITGFDFGCCGAADAIPGATAPFANALTLNGFNGDDFLASGDGNDTFLGAAGSDTVSYEAASGPVVVDLTAGTGTGMGTDTLTDVQNAIGGDFDDTITGNGLDNALDGGLGNDTVDGLAGTDVVNGGGGNDHVLGGDGAFDVVDGDAGNDNVDEGAAANGADFLFGDTGTDTLNYGARTTDTRAVANTGENGQIAPAESDDITGDFEVYVTGSGNDVLGGDGSVETFRPQGGNDSVDGGGGTDTFDWVTGPVTVDLDGGTATGEGSDTFTSIESLDLTDGDDTVLWANTVPLVNVVGGAGTDTINASAAVVAVSIDLGAFTPGDDVENAIGGAGSDTLIGNVRNNVLTGNAGDDFIDGEEGNDTIEGNAGNDTMIGGNGADTLVFIHAPSGEEIDTQLGFASGGDGEDAVTFFEIVKGSDFADTIVAGQNAFSLNNRLFGRGGADNITGSASSDLLVGGGANDTIRAGGGDDTLKGNKGADLLVGGGGFDIGFGGSGNDECRKVEQKHSC
jgi:Ca2+-binding RTX toxin-like protein